MAQLSCCVKLKARLVRSQQNCCAGCAVALIGNRDVRGPSSRFLNCRYTLSWGNSGWGWARQLYSLALAGPANWFVPMSKRMHTTIEGTRNAKRWDRVYVSQNVRWPTELFTRRYEQNSHSRELYSPATLQATRPRCYSTMP
jgi:hypothetical protein